ncbi:MAG TPA: glycogen synthase GlgA [Candidatus Binatia bacterium]|jgi:starch synthase
MTASECVPLAKTGGLGDVVGALSGALAGLGAEVAVALPAYQSILESGRPLQKTGMEVETRLDKNRVTGTVLKTELDGGVPVYLIQADPYFRRPQFYGTPQGDYPDNAERFTFFSKAVLQLALSTGPWDVIHSHDWQSALVPVLKKLDAKSWPELQNAKTVLTIHNLAHQGLFPFASWNLLNLEARYFAPEYLEFYGRINVLKGGILFADALTTVSRKYAEEILTPEYGCGLEGVLRDRERDLHGILNGIDYREWNPATDPHIKKQYSAANLRGKQVCKKDLQDLYGLPPKAATPMIGIVSRLADQKGLDILLEVIEDILRFDLQLVILGAGDQKYQDALAQLPKTYPGKIGVKIAFENVLAHQIEAGADMFLMPSKYEPCGLNQIYSLKYGTVPIVRATGGLDDTIEDYDPLAGTGNGFKFTGYSGSELLQAIKRALAVCVNKKAWKQVIANGMACDFSWEKSAKAYLELYRTLTQQ